jgi:UDP-glucose 4-epimerase
VSRSADEAVLDRSVLVTGANTPLGERLVRSLLADSRVDQVVAVVGGPPEQFAVRPNARLTTIQLDLLRGRRVRNLLFGLARDKGIHVVVHLAMHRSARARGSKVHAFNVEALRNIIALSERHPTIERLVLRSDAAVYKVKEDLPILIDETHPVALDGRQPQWVRDRVEADVTACARMGMSPLQITVLRMTDILAPGTGSQLYDYLQSPVCLRPAGYDPMTNLLTIPDAAVALLKAVHSRAQGIFNIPGSDTLPLSACIRSYGRIGLPIPGTALSPLYRWRSRLTGHDFSYGLNRRRFHYSCVLDGKRARDVLRYVPAHPIEWPAA